MFDGLEIDMVSVGDADCLVVTHWTAHLGAQRILIDGGKASDFPMIKDFLISRGMKDFWALVCTHLHGDHAGGLISLVQDPAFTFQQAWMHDIRNHVSDEALRRASSGNSPEAEGVKEVWETTKELSRAFASRRLSPQEPFTGAPIATFRPKEQQSYTAPTLRRSLELLCPSQGLRERNCPLLHGQPAETPLRDAATLPRKLSPRRQADLLVRVRARRRALLLPVASLGALPIARSFFLFPAEAKLWPAPSHVSLWRARFP